MSLADQSQQWFPTSAQVTVLQARGLRIKGKNGTNDAYAIMQVAKDKFSTSVAEKSVTPMWKEQASFDLPPVHHGNAERGTLRVHVMHRALVGPDKPLGQAVVNLLELHEVKSRNKTEWFKLLDKAGKADKERGEVLLDIQFMRNNMTASMFDLSGTDKSRSRMGKFKDKLRGKKKDGGGGLDSVSAIVPSSFSQVLTDSEGDEDAASVEGAAGDTREKNGKKKLKLKSLFSHKSNLQKNTSQSMSFLGPLPERNQTLSGSRSSGLNVEPSEGKKKFKFGIHKRSGSNDSKSSQASSSVPDPAQYGGPDAARPGSHAGGGHAYTEEPTARTGSRASSTFSLSSSGRGSMEDLHRGPGGSMEGSFSSYDSLRVPRPQSSAWMGSKATEEEVKVEEEELDVSEYERRKEEEEMARQEEQMRIERRREEEEQRKRLDEVRMRREEMVKREIEEQQRKYQRDEEDRIRIEREREEEERLRREEEMARIEDERKEEEGKRREVEEERERIRKMEEERKVQEEEEERFRMKEEIERAEREEKERREEERTRMEEEEKMKRELEEKQERIRIEKEKERLEEEYKKERVRLEKEREEEERRVREEEEERMSEIQEKEERRLRERELEEERFRMEKEREEEERRVREEEEEERMSEIQEKEERRLRERELEEERFRMEKEREEERRVEEETTRIEKERKHQEEERISMEEEEKRRREVAEEEEQEDKRQEESERLRREESLLEEQRIKRQEQVRREEEESERVKEQQRWEDERRESEEEGDKLEEEFMTKAPMKNTPFDLQSAPESYLGPNFELTNNSPGGIESARRRGPVRSTPPSEDNDPRTPDGPFDSRTADVPTSRQSPASRRTPPLLFEPSNPFFEASESESEEQLSGKKRRAPRPPSNQEFPHDKPCDPSAAVSTVPSVSPRGGIKTSLHLDQGSDGEKDSPRAARTAPQPPKRHGPQIEQIASKEKTIQTVHANRTCDAPQPSRNPKGPAPAKPNPNRTTVSAQLHDGRPEHAPRTALSFKDNWKNANTSGPHTVTEQRPSTYGRNPFDEDENDDDDGIHPADQEDKHLSGGEARTPVDADGSSSSKMRSLKTVRAPAPPEDKGSVPVTPSGNLYSETQVTVSSSERPVGLPPIGDTSETQPTVQPRRTEATAEQEGRVETATRPASVGSETGAGPPSPSRRSLPVKPLRVFQQQSANSSVSAWTGNPPSEILRAGRDAVEVKGEEARGPFSQLTRGELVLLLQKLQGQLTQRDHKISELEQYIDNLLVRIMEEEPSILMSLSALKH